MENERPTQLKAGMRFRGRVTLVVYRTTDANGSCVDEHTGQAYKSTFLLNDDCYEYLGTTPDAEPAKGGPGVVAAVVESSGVRIVGEYHGSNLMHGRNVVASMARLYPSPPAVEPAPEQPRQSHCLDAGRGIWRTR